MRIERTIVKMEYSVEQIRPDGDGAEFCLAKYKPFRLHALKTEPQCGCSNLTDSPIVSEN